MRLVVVGLLVWALGSCGQLERDNPLDPGAEGEGEDEGIQLIASLPGGDPGVAEDRLVEFRFEVSAADMAEPVQGNMDLVGGSARALVRGVPDGINRVFRVEAFDLNHIRTFSAMETIDVQDGVPQAVLLNLERLQGSLEITSELPSEVVALEVVIAADADSLRHLFEKVEISLKERITSIPTGTGVGVVLRGQDADGQVLIEREVWVDIRDDRVEHLSWSAVTGALQITANFPDYISIVPVDRFSDAAGTFFRRSEVSDLPGPGEPVDFDEERFLLRGVGPNGGPVEFYHFDVCTPVPAVAYVLVDRRENPIAGQLNIFDLVPGDEGYSDFWQIHQVRVLDRDYRPNSLTSLQDLLDGEYEIIPTTGVMNGVMVPAGSRASRRFDPQMPADPQDGWYRGQVVKYLLFENPSSTAQVAFGENEINTPQMYGFFENDKDEIESFAVDPETGDTHNVVTSLPGEEGYSPLWVLQILKLAVFEETLDVASALDLSRNEENLLVLPELLYINGPIVGVE